jgi:hypothetical protein
MPPTPGDASLSGSPEVRIPPLAELYEKFAHSLEPFSEERDNAEQVFVLEILTWWQALENPKPSFQEFRRGVIAKCRRFLAASDKPQDKQFFRGLDESQSSP